MGAGLDAAHAAGLVHRDVKPANVLIAGEDGRGHVYLSDFGLTLEASSSARLTQSGEWIGTVDFMAPEQFEGGHVDGRTDVYALGCLLHAMLSGHPPFRRATVVATLLAHLRDRPPQPSATAGVPSSFDGVIARALAKRPSDRYSSAGELVEAAVSAAESAVGGPGVATGSALMQNGSGDPAAAEAERADPCSVGHDDCPARRSSKGQVGARAVAHRAAQPRAPRPKPQMLVAAAASLAVGGGIAALVTGLGPLGGGEASGPLTEPEVRGAVHAFAKAYA